jgi:hypothetical protein
MQRKKGGGKREKSAPSPLARRGRGQRRGPRGRCCRRGEAQLLLSGSGCCCRHRGAGWRPRRPRRRRCSSPRRRRCCSASSRGRGESAAAAGGGLGSASASAGGKSGRRVARSCRCRFRGAAGESPKRRRRRRRRRRRGSSRNGSRRLRSIAPCRDRKPPRVPQLDPVAERGTGSRRRAGGGGKQPADKEHRLPAEVPELAFLSFCGLSSSSPHPLFCGPLRVSDRGERRWLLHRVRQHDGRRRRRRSRRGR